MEKFSKKRVLDYMKWKYHSQLDKVNDMNETNSNENQINYHRTKLETLRKVYSDLLGLDRIDIPQTYKHR